MELLIVARPHPSPYIDIGDIVDVRPDGFQWGTEELLDPIFRIRRVPDADSVALGLRAEAVPNPSDLDGQPVSNFRWSLVGNQLRETLTNGSRQNRRATNPTDVPGHPSRRP